MTLRPADAPRGKPSWNLATTSSTRALSMAMEPANRCWVISTPPNGSPSPRGFIPETLPIGRRIYVISKVDSASRGAICLGRSISCVGEVICAFCRGEAVEQRADGSPGLFNGFRASALRRAGF